jgi:hypothetical protein
VPAMAPMTAPAPLAAQSDRTLQEKSQVQGANTPPIIIWNDSGRSGGPLGAGGGMGGSPTGAAAAGMPVPATSDTTTAELDPAASAAAATPTPVMKSAAALAPSWVSLLHKNAVKWWPIPY